MKDRFLKYLTIVLTISLFGSIPVHAAETNDEDSTINAVWEMTEESSSEAETPVGASGETFSETSAEDISGESTADAETVAEHESG